MGGSEQISWCCRILRTVVVAGLVEEFPLENGNQSSFYLEENEEEEETREGENEGEKTVT